MFKNKLLKRQFKKHLKIADRSEVLRAISDLKDSINSNEVDKNVLSLLENFDNFLSNLEDTIESLEHSLRVRDRTISVSSMELTELNKIIVEESKNKGQTLEKLFEIVRLADDKILDKENDINKNSLASILNVVEGLVRNYIENAKSLEKLFQESSNLASCMSLSCLQSQVEKSFDELIQEKVKVKFFINGKNTGSPANEGFYKLDEKGQVIEETLLSQSKKCDYQLVGDPKGEGVTAIIEFFWEEDIPSVRRDYYLGYLNAMSSVIAKTIDNIQFLENEKKRQHLENELKTARLVQNTLLPQAKPVEVNGLNLCGYYNSASECGGDWWNFHSVGENETLIFVGDVTGHGTASAMLSAVVRGYCDSLEFRETIKTNEILSELNKVVFQISQKSNRYMTMFCLRVNTKKNLISYSNAGHNNPILITSDGQLKYLVGSGPTLGFEERSQFEEKEIEFSPSDSLFLFSDGLVECVDPQDQMYGNGRLQRLLRKNSTQHQASHYIRLVNDDMQKFRKGEELHDDVTMVAVKFIQ